MRKLGTPPASGPPLEAPPVAPQRSGRCPATTRHIPLYSTQSVGLQCKFTSGHDGDHAGGAGLSTGDVFWPQAAR